MKILLIGDFSGIYTNLRKGLNELGHTVVLASDGNGKKNFNRDINLTWDGKFRYLKLLMRLPGLLFRLRAYDVVQLVGIPFIDMRPKFYGLLFWYLKRMNKSIFVGSNTFERQYLEYAEKVGFKTSFMNIPRVLNDSWVKNNLVDKQVNEYSKVHRYITEQVDGVIACCCEYYLAVAWQDYPKSKFIPLPYSVESDGDVSILGDGEINILLGKQGVRSSFKGMDVIEKALKAIKAKYPNEINLNVVDSIPYEEYLQAVDEADLVCDQLYSYGAGLSAVIGMSKGKVVLGGGEGEMWKLFGVEDGPIVNLPDDEQGVFDVVEALILDKEKLTVLSKASRAFAVEYHDHIKVAQQYVDFWQQKADL